MRIGVDARLLSQPVTGIGRYTAELSKALLKEGVELVLYAPAPLVVGDWSDSRVTVRTSHLRGRIPRMLWSQTILPYQASHDRLDIFWGATHRLPRYLPARLPRVVTVHDLVWRFAGETMRPLSRFMEKRLMPEAVSMADRVLAVSKSTAQDLESVFPSSRGKVRAVLLGANSLAAPDELQTLNTFAIDRPYFLFVGTLEPRKNLRRLLAGYALLAEGIRKEFQFVIAGGKGWGGVDVPQLLEEFGLDKSEVRITGYVSDAQLSTLYAYAHFLAMPSLYEGFGFPLIEAMSFGVPVLTSNVSSLPEVAGDAGLLVDPRDESQIAHGLEQLLCNKALHARLASNARANARKFTWKKTAQESLAVFAEAIEVRKFSRSVRQGR